MSWQATITVYAALLGGFLGAVYDVIRLSRALIGVRYSDRLSSRLARTSLPLIGCLPFEVIRSRKRREMATNLFIAVGDVCFFLVASVAVPVFLYHANNGILRWYLLVGILLGFVLYRMTLGRLTEMFSEIFTFVVRALGAYLFRFLARPVFSAFAWLTNILCKSFACVKNRCDVYCMKKYTKKIENSIEIFSDFL